jgi:Leucine-rich repeat (LRR) protein
MYGAARVSTRLPSLYWLVLRLVHIVRFISLLQSCCGWPIVKLLLPSKKTLIDFRLTRGCLNWLVQAALSIGAAVCISGAGGCNSASDKNSANSSATQQTPPTLNGLDSAATATPLVQLEAAGVKFTTNARSGVVESAELGGIEITDELAEQIAQLSTLVNLSLRNSTMTQKGWAALAKLDQLQSLDLRECPLSNENLAVVSSMHLLRSLRLNGKTGNCTVDDSGLQVLQQLPKLRVLALDGVKIGSVGLKQLSACPQISELYLGQTGVDDSSLQSLSAMSLLKKLRLSQTRIGAEGLQYLVSLPLEDLDVSECPAVNDQALSVIGKYTQLRRLNLWRDPVTSAGLVDLAGLTKIQWLNLDNTQIDDAGLPAIAGLPELAFLHLGSTVVSDAGMPALGPLKSLKKLVVTRTQVSEAGARSLMQTIDGLDIQLQYIAGQ